MTHWISVNDEKKPHLNQEILVYIEDIAEFVTAKLLVNFPGYFHPACTHWLEIPPLEEEKE